MLDLNIVLTQAVNWNTIIAALIIAVICAIIGSAMNLTIAYVNKAREKYAHNSHIKFIEVLLLASVTITTAFLIPFIYSRKGSCQ